MTNRITTNAALSALTQDQIAERWKSGDIDYEAIGAERAAARDVDRNRANRIRSAIRGGLSHADAIARADA